MATDNELPRRQWLKLSFGAALGGISAQGCGRESVDEECPPTQYETMGPFHPKRDQSDKDFDLTLFNGSSKRAEGDVIYVRGRVTDEACEPISGAVVMIWHANTYGKYTHEYDTHEAMDDPNFQGWGQVVTNDQGEYGFKTIKPAAYPVNLENDEWRTPHIHFKVSRRGYHELITQMYFDGEDLNEKDMYASVLSDAEKAQVIRKAVTGAEGIGEGTSLIQFDLTLRMVGAKGNLRSDVDEFVGEYSIDIRVPEFERELVQFYGGEREDLILTISREDGLLFAEMPIQPRAEIFHDTEDTWVYRAFEANIEFQRNSSNAVVGLTLHRHYDFPAVVGHKLR